MNTKFSLGQTVATRGILELFDEAEIFNLLSRHVTGDFGDLSKEDLDLNNYALENKYGRLFSSYNTSKGKIWIITEHDYSVTTVLLPSEY